jgi:hypothetical protein
VCREALNLLPVNRRGKPFPFSLLRGRPYCSGRIIPSNARNPVHGFSAFIASVWVCMGSLAWVISTVPAVAQTLSASGLVLLGSRTNETEKIVATNRFSLVAVENQKWELWMQWSPEHRSCFVNDGSSLFRYVEQPDSFGNAPSKPERINERGHQLSTAASALNVEHIPSTATETERMILFALTGYRFFDLGWAPFEVIRSAQDIFTIHIQRQTNGFHLPIRATWVVDGEKRQRKLMEVKGKNDQEAMYLKKAFLDGRTWATYEAEFREVDGIEIPFRCELQYRSRPVLILGAWFMRIIVTNVLVRASAVQIQPPSLLPGTCVSDVRMGEHFLYKSRHGGWLPIAELPRNAILVPKVLPNESEQGISFKTAAVWLLIVLVVVPPIFYGSRLFLRKFRQTKQTQTLKGATHEETSE